jgi:endoglucanase
MIQRRFPRKFFTLASKLLLIAILWLGGTYAFEIINSLNIIPSKIVTDVSADGNINIWWPTQNSKISDTQTFKAVVQDKNVNNYDMFWLVDGGQPNKMYDSSTDYPHKEASVDLGGWTWKGSGPYKVTFRAVDKSGVQLGESSVDISTPNSAQGPVVVESGTVNSSQVAPTPAPVSQVVQQINNVVSQVVSPTQVAAAASSDQSSKHISVWWPTQNATVKGVQPFKAVVDGMSSDSYKMFWQVDNGQLNEMSSNSTDGAHKEAQVDLTNWSWKGNNSYLITFTAKDMNGSILAKANTSIYVNSISANQPQTTTNKTTTVAAVVQAVQPVLQTQNSQSSSDPFNGEKLWVNNNSDAKHQADAWRSSRPSDASQLDKIAQSADVVWLGEWNSDISQDVKNKISEIKGQGALPVFIAYNIPNRDCGQYSSGGVGSADAYRSWIQKIADAIGGNKAVVVLEPDGLTLTDCLSSSQKTERFNLIKDSVSILKSKGNIGVYIDAGHPAWISAQDMADRLNKSGISQANGFSLNISNFFTTTDNINYGQDISSKTGGKHFVIDTGRNGLGPTADNQWCNPWGRALGIRPTTNTGNSSVDAYLWVKGPGGSDGNCNGGPSAGHWWADYALDLAKHSVF